MADTSAAQARRGKDIQGIPWERLSITREKYRQTRLEQYRNYENIPQSGEGSEKVELSSTYIYFLIFFPWIYLIPMCTCYLVCNVTLSYVFPSLLWVGMQNYKKGGIVLWVQTQFKICEIDNSSFSGMLTPIVYASRPLTNYTMFG